MRREKVTTAKLLEMKVEGKKIAALTPQSIRQFGGYGVRARAEEEARKRVHDAEILEQAGVFCIVLEKIPFW